MCEQLLTVVAAHDLLDWQISVYQTSAYVERQHDNRSSLWGSHKSQHLNWKVQNWANIDTAALNNVMAFPASEDFEFCTIILFRRRC